MYRGSPDPKRPRLSGPLPGPAPYSIPQSHSNNTSLASPQIMGPPQIRLQPGLYPPQPQGGGLSVIRPSISPNPMPPPTSLPAEDRPQDAEQLQDALASAGVDLKAEEFHLSQLMTPTSATVPQPALMFPPSYTGGALQVQQQIDEGKLLFNRTVLSRLVDRIGSPVSPDNVDW